MLLLSASWFRNTTKICQYKKSYSSYPRQMKNANVPSFDAFDALMIEIIKYSNSVSSDDSDIRFLESLGVSVSEKLIEKATKDHARFINELDIVKYVCTEFWSSVYHKQVDTLKTNYQDVYVLIVNDFQPLVKFDSIPEGISEIPKYLAFPSGLLKGALCSLGLNCVVAADCEQPPTCKFTVTVLSYRGIS